LRNRVKDYARQANLGRRVPHELRHSAATHLVQHGASLVAVMQVLGHSSLRTTEIYISASALMGFEAMHTCHPRSMGGEGGAIIAVPSREILPKLSPPQARERVG
jgi:site-specific recombinase XerD